MTGQLYVLYRPKSGLQQWLRTEAVGAVSALGLSSRLRQDGFVSAVVAAVRSVDASANLDEDWQSLAMRVESLPPQRCDLVRGMCLS